ncbi:unnamed protein product [Pelagomonas calceolata]|uniref:Sulfotransferase n=1 Tax=Pelagomonas calceolata TaxID=35677 RepID=A0A8J2SIN0_9STRA|nr:unnamed protein product [Pelagomonas calceolata]
MQDKFRFFHVPKAGSSFAPLVWAMACEAGNKSLDLLLKPGGLTRFPAGVLGPRCNVRYLGGGSRVEPDYHHAALRGDEEVAAAIGVFREPASRIVSAYHYDYHVHLPTWDQAPINRTALLALPEANSTRLLAFARLPIVSNTATKMLIGSPPGSIRRIVAADITLALRRVAALRFVAITECLHEAADVLRVAKHDWGLDNVSLPPLRSFRTNSLLGANDRQLDILAVTADLLRRCSVHDMDEYDADVEIYNVAACRFHRARHIAHVEPQSPLCAESARTFSPQFCRARHI